MRKTKEIKNNKGITLVSLIIVIIVLFIIASVGVSVSYDRFEINKYNKMKNDIEFLTEKISNYYLRYNGLPILRDDDGEPLVFTQYNEEKYYVIDLEAMEGLALNYGKEGYEELKITKSITQIEGLDLYIINENTHSIYYVKGIEVDGVNYYTIGNNNESSIDIVPPTKPQIKIVSGNLIQENNEEYYLGKVILEFISGIDKQSQIVSTTYSINGSEEIDIKTLDNNIYIIENQNGIFNIILKTVSDNGMESVTETNIIAKRIKDGTISDYGLTENNIGDFIKYDCYTDVATDDLTYVSKSDKNGYTKVSSQTFTVREEDKEKKWRILGVEDGSLLITTADPISTTDEIGYYLKWKNGYKYGEEELNKISAIYGHGKYSDTSIYTYDYDGVSKKSGGRSINIEDCNNIVGYNPTVGNNIIYTLESDGYIYTNGSISTRTAFTGYNEETREFITLSNAEGEENTFETHNTYYTYEILDGKGNVLKYGSDGETYINYWFASKSIRTMGGYCMFAYRSIIDGETGAPYFYYSWGSTPTRCNYVRPVVRLKTEIKLQKDVNGVWQISEDV